MYILLFIVIIALALGLYQKSTNAFCSSKKRLDGKTVIVTGGTTGMGLKIATDLAERGARVIIACPFPDEGELAQKNIIEETSNEDVAFELLDLSSIDSVKKFANKINETEDRLHILINNAGVARALNDVTTDDGMSFTMQVNYFGHFLLTLLLLPLLKKGAKPLEPARIVNTSSILHNIGSMNFEKINDVKYLYPIQFYANSKLSLLLFAHELTKKLKGSNVVVNSVDPGAVGTGIFSCFGALFGGIITLGFFVFFKTSWEGAQTALHVALDKKAGTVSGQLFKNCRLSRAKDAAYDDELSKQLWAESVKLVGLSVEEVEHCLQITEAT